VLTATLAIIIGAVWAWVCDWQWWDWAFLVLLAGVVAIQVWNIYPYTRLARPQVLRTDRSQPRTSIRLVATNVLMENREFDKWREVIRAADADVILAVEVNEAWMERAIRALVPDWPHVVAEPRDNHYGMVLLSRLELVDPQVRHDVQRDIPSIHCGVRLRSGDVINLHCLHPRPPEPLTDQHATPRDAELVLVGRAIGDDPDDPPTIVTGDLNDVAWSHTTRLFLRLSGLLDPRIGRGFFNSYNAKNPLFRFPLDHFFHSNDFRLIELRRLDFVGSDHFPMYLALSYEPARQKEQPEPEEKSDDHEQADEMLEDQAQEQAANSHADHRSGHAKAVATVPVASSPTCGGSNRVHASMTPELCLPASSGVSAPTPSIC
jgi:endonuclease/exonuclease/phosphatase (EEP) superfamily protein YafD